MNNFADQDAPSSMRIMSQVIVGFSSILWVYFLVVAITCAITLSQLRKKGTRSKNSKKGKMSFWIFFNSVASFLMTSNNLFLMFSFNYQSTESNNPCQFFARNSAIFYPCSVWGTYMSFVNRCSGMDHKSNLMIWFHRLTDYSAMFGFPTATVVSYFFFRGTLLFRDEFCVLTLPTTPMVAMMILDTCLSANFLVLFFGPVLDYLKKLQTEQSTPDLQSEAVMLQRAAIRNLYLSLIQIVSTFSVLLTTVIINIYLEDHEDLPEKQYLRYIAYMLYLPDAFVNNFVLLFMTNVWVPEGWKSTKRFFSFKRRKKSRKKNRVYSTQ